MTPLKIIAVALAILGLTAAIVYTRRSGRLLLLDLAFVAALRHPALLCGNPVQ
jgi:hypothetical protein